MIRENRLVGDIITWEDFWAGFLEGYQPDSLRERRAFEFEDLTHVSGSMDAYAWRFIQLSVYAPNLVTTDRQRIRRFIWSLPTYMQRILASNPDLTFTQVVDMAQHLEKLDGGQDGGAIGEPNKRAQTES